MTVATHLLLLPADPAAAATHLAIDTAGRVVARREAGDGSPLPADPLQPPPRRVLAVPGVDCLALWLDLPARNPVQALAAATLLVEDHVAAAARHPLHIAIAPLPPDGGKRLVVAVEPEHMQGWLDRAAALGMTPDAVTPAPLLLPRPANEAGDAVALACHDGLWLVRGQCLAFAAEPALAAEILGDRPRTALPDAGAALAGGALAPAIDLLQGRFAAAPSRHTGWPAWRRAAMLAAVLALSPLLLLAAQALRHELGARGLESRTLAQARAVLPSLGERVDPLPAVRARLEALRSADAFAALTGALLRAVADDAGAELDALAYADGELQAVVAHGDAATLERIRAALAGDGFELVETGTRTAGDRIHSDIQVRPAP